MAPTHGNKSRPNAVEHHGRWAKRGHADGTDAREIIWRCVGVVEYV